MLQHTYQHDYKPSHKPRPVAIVEAEEEAAWCWKRLDEHLEARDPNLTHYDTEWWIELQRLQAAANAAAEWLTDLRYQALTCTCDPDPRRESTLCPACRAVNAEKELPF
jgi:hypothetical protein